MGKGAPTNGPNSDTAVAQGRGILAFGSLAYLGAAGSVVMCYATVLGTLIAPLLGLATLGMNPHLQAVLMWSFALVAVVGLARDRRKHARNLPLLLAIAAFAIIVITLYTYYHSLILVLGYILLIVAAFVNQNILLTKLNREVKAQAGQLAELNSTLEQRVEKQVSEIEKLAKLKRFLAPQVASLITAEGREALLDSHRSYIACLFCDIRNFTPLSESVEPEEVMNVLQTYHDCADRLIAERGGTIGFRAGDGLMVFFNDPLPCDAPVLDAARLALDIRRAFGEMRQKWEKLGHKLGLGIGIASGYATLGVVGHEGRLDYTAIGHVVNIAARLCDAAADGQILLNRRAYVDVEGEVTVETSRPLALKGLDKEVEVYNLVDLNRTVVPLRQVRT